MELQMFYIIKEILLQPLYYVLVLLLYYISNTALSMVLTILIWTSCFKRQTTELLLFQTLL